MKTRPAKSFAGAITEIKAALTDKQCAEIVSRSASLVRKWSDPDHPALPGLEQALALDLAFVEAGHGKPPILDLYAERLADALDKRQRRSVDILLAALSVQSVVGDLSGAIRDAVHPNGPGGQALTSRERATILDLLARLEHEADAIEDTIEDDEP